jgi:hypothetical protein
VSERTAGPGTASDAVESDAVESDAVESDAAEPEPGAEVGPAPGTPDLPDGPR